MVFQYLANKRREANVRKFLRKSGYNTLENLQQAIESGDLLQRYDLDTPQNRLRYNRRADPTTTPPTTTLVGVQVDEYVHPTNTGIKYNPVTELDPNAAISPQGVSTNGLLSAIAQYLPFRDVFYHRDKQREVAKGLLDSYKELQRSYVENVATDPTTGEIVITRERLSVDSAGEIIKGRRYKTSRSTLEGLLTNLGYTGKVEIRKTSTRSPRGVPAYGVPAYGIPTTTVDSVSFNIPKAHEIRESYGKLTVNPKTWLQAIPDEVLAGIRTVALTGVIAGVAVGAYAPLAAYVGGRAVSGVAVSAASHFVRQAGRDYITHEDGLQNIAELAGKIGGLAAYSGTAALIGGTLGVGYVTAMLAGSAITRYVANRKRQNARDTQRQLEEVLQTGANDPNLQNNINRNILSAERYEAASAGLDILSLLGMGLGGLGSIHFPWESSADDTAPGISYTGYEHTGIKFDATAFDNRDVQTVTADLVKADPGTTLDSPALQSSLLHSDGFFDNYVLDPIARLFGKQTVDVDGLFTAQPGQYLVRLNVTDGAGNSSSQFIDNIFTIGDGTDPIDPPQPPVCPVECFDIDSLYGQDIQGIDLHENFLDHGTRLKGEFHELGLHLDKTTFDDGFVTLNGLHDAHTPQGYNLDNTVIMAEGYDASGKLEFRQLYDVNADGKFTLNGFDETQYSNWQITWAEAECVDGNLELDSLSSYTHGKVPLSETWESPAVDTTPVPSHAGTIHAPDGDHSLRITPEQTNTGAGIVVYDSWNHGTELRIDVYGADGNYVLGSVRDIPAGAGTAHISNFADNLPAGSYIAHVSGSDTHGLQANYVKDFQVGEDITQINTPTLGTTSLHDWNTPTLEHGIPTGYQATTTSTEPVANIASATTDLHSWEPATLDSGMLAQNMYAGTTHVEPVANIAPQTTDLHSWEPATLDSGMPAQNMYTGTNVPIANTAPASTDLHSWNPATLDSGMPAQNMYTGTNAPIANTAPASTDLHLWESATFDSGMLVGKTASSTDVNALDSLHNWNTSISLEQGLPTSEMMSSALISTPDAEQEPEPNIRNWSPSNDGSSDLWTNLAPEELVSYKPNNMNDFMLLSEIEKEYSSALLRELEELQKNAA